MGGDTYFSAGSINWTAVVEYLITEVACETCPVAQLPKQQLRSDLSQGQGGPLGMPCRVGQDANRCIHGLTPNDSFDVRVPWEWSQHPGINNDGGDYRAKSYEDLLTAWQAQADKEQAEAELAINDEPAPEDSSTIEKREQTSSTNKQRPDETPTRNKPMKDSPIGKQRTQIADFMKQHEQLAVNHPFATPCGRCRHRLDSSPTKDETVPHCAWAGRLRNVTFNVLASDIQDAPHVPVCRQFVPNQPWHELIPAHPGLPEMPRDWLKEQIQHLVKAANRHGSDRNAFEFLTGRPMGANENYGDWFSQQMDAQSGDLSDAQLFTLFVWAHTEWQRARDSRFSLPLSGQAMQFGMYEERPWKMKEAS